MHVHAFQERLDDLRELGPAGGLPDPLVQQGSGAPARGAEDGRRFRLRTEASEAAVFGRFQAVFEVFRPVSAWFQAL